MWLCYSQSVETADTMAAIKLAKENGAFVFGVCNVVGSSISRETHAGAYTHAGPEIRLLLQKAFTTQIGIDNDCYVWLKKPGTLSHSDFHMYLQELELIQKVKEALETMLKQGNSQLLKMRQLFVPRKRV
jgi:glucosamine--fructose-6-phosphate aminotransferase (isomerizing)